MCVFVTRSVHVYFNWSFSQQCDYIGTPSNNEPSTLSTIPISLFDSSSTSFTTASLPQQIEIESHGPKNRPAKLTATTNKNSKRNNAIMPDAARWNKNKKKARVFLRRCVARVLESRPPASWSGVWTRSCSVLMSYCACVRVCHALHRREVKKKKWRIEELFSFFPSVLLLTLTKEKENKKKNCWRVRCCFSFRATSVPLWPPSRQLPEQNKKQLDRLRRRRKMLHF